MFSSDNNKFLAISSLQKLNSRDNSISLSNSLSGPSAIHKSCRNSFCVFCALPSAIFTGIEIAALRICDTIPNFSSYGNKAVASYASFTKAKPDFHASGFLCGVHIICFIQLSSLTHCSLLTVYCSPFTSHQ